ncbi:hypothetical protein HU200_010312 [Digitaria exilis]|uniref:Uncharacterized protein n=1 Tax=Digitaria exilis TaxID=1010633 RepID=A0A835KNI0_9POAL|nr:hypothetical protein HU200_010312 [Digitaria exilis]
MARVYAPAALASSESQGCTWPGDCAGCPHDLPIYEGGYEVIPHLRPKPFIRPCAADALFLFNYVIRPDLTHLCHVGSNVVETLDRPRELGTRSPGAHPCNLGAKLKDRAWLPPQPPSSSSSVQTEQKGIQRLLLPPPPNPPLREVHSSVLASTTTLGKKKWKDRAQKNYPDVSSKDAPVPPALPSPQCECGKPARVTQSMHPDTAARAYYKYGDHRKVDERILLFRPSSSKNYESFQRWLPPPPNPPPMTNEEKKEAIARHSSHREELFFHTNV